MYTFSPWGVTRFSSGVSCKELSQAASNWKNTLNKAKTRHDK